MHLCRVKIKNFRNFSNLDLPLDNNVVIVGENRVGKSNFIYAIRLVLDMSLPDSARQLKLSDIWDGYENNIQSSGEAESDDEEAISITDSPQVEIHLDFKGFDNDDDLTALLTDYRLAEDHTIARLSYVFRKKEEIEEPPKSEADFDFKIFGGNDETRTVSYQVRRRICLDVLNALRDAESDLGSWRNSPLRPLLEDALSRVSEDDLEKVADSINEATKEMAELDPIHELEENLRDKITEIAGETQDIKPKLGFASSDPLRLFRSISVFVDDGKRGISEASVGSANLALLTFKIAEFNWRREKNERNFTILAVEEPEAHLHPHLQRKVFGTLFQDQEEQNRSLFLTTHSPNIAAVAPLHSIVLLKDEENKGTRGYSLADISLNQNEIDDLQRYLIVSRAELLFSRGVIFVEGDAEEILLPVFASNLGYNLDDLGITVCNVGGTNFKPYARLAAALSLPFSIVTDWDPRESGDKAYGCQRSINLIKAIRNARNQLSLSRKRIETLTNDEDTLRKVTIRYGIFLNEDTLETEIAKTTGLVRPLLEVLAEQKFGLKLKRRIREWQEDHSKIDTAQLMLMIGYISKGRFASMIAEKVVDFNPPEYIKLAIEHVINYG